MPMFMLFVAPAGSDPSAHARALWGADDVDEVEGVSHWDAATRAGLARDIADADRRLAAGVHEDEDALYLSTETDPGVDYEVRATSVLVEVDDFGEDDAATDRLVAATLEVLDRIAYRHGLTVWSDELGRVIDPRRDGAALAAHLAARRHAAGAGRRNQRWAFVLFVVAAVVAAAIAVVVGTR